MSPSTVLVTGASRFIGGELRPDSRAILRSPACLLWIAVPASRVVAADGTRRFASRPAQTVDR
jgi:hypothetical protein